MGDDVPLSQNTKYKVSVCLNVITYYKGAPNLQIVITEISKDIPGLKYFGVFVKWMV